MHLGIVVPRYGDVVGGAEHLMARLGEELVARLGWRVDVFTTGAHSAVDWAEVERPGRTERNGVTVHRFASVSGRDPRWGALAQAAELTPGALDGDGQRRYFELQGPVCPDVLDAAADSDADLVAFAPYLFWPTVAGVPRLGRRAVVHSCTHDEAALYLEPLRAVFADPGGICFLSHAEAELVRSRFPIDHVPQVVLGGGVEAPPPDTGATAARERLGLIDRPYVVCLGRVENGKGARLLDRWYREYVHRHPGAPALVFVGPALERLDHHPDIVVTDRVDDADKWELLRGAQVLISPSAMESFSFVVLEGWQAGVPALVNAACGPTVEHVTLGHGGLTFADYPTFDTALTRLLADPGLRRRLAAGGLAHVDRRFQWADLVERYATFCDRALRHRLLR